MAKRKTIKELEAELIREKERAEMHYEDYQDELRKRQKREEEERNDMVLGVRKAEKTTGELLEVIRWMINPETARAPFSTLFKDGDKEVKGRF